MHGGGFGGCNLVAFGVHVGCDVGVLFGEAMVFALLSLLYQLIEKTPSL